MRCNIFQLCFK